MVRNNNSQPVAFKVKTTAPKVLSPASSCSPRIVTSHAPILSQSALLRQTQLWESGAGSDSRSVGCVAVQSPIAVFADVIHLPVLLQPMKEEPPVAAKCKDKFLVQSTFISPDKDEMPLQDLVSHQSARAGSVLILIHLVVAAGRARWSSPPAEDQGRIPPPRG